MAVGYRIAGVVLGQTVVTQVNLYRSGQGESQCTRPGLHPTGQRLLRTSGVDSRSACFPVDPVDDVHQARITEGVGGWGWHLERIKRGISWIFRFLH